MPSPSIPGVCGVCGSDKPVYFYYRSEAYTPSIMCRCAKHKITWDHSQFRWTLLTKEEYIILITLNE